MLFSIINMKLRDNDMNLSELCDDLNVSEDEIKNKLHEIGFNYDESTRRFK